MSYMVPCKDLQSIGDTYHTFSCLLLFERNICSRVWVNNNQLGGISMMLYCPCMACSRGSILFILRAGYKTLFMVPNDRRSMTTYYYCSVNRHSGLQSNTFSKLSYIFLIHQNVPQIMSFHLRYMMVSLVKRFWSYEGRKVGYSACAELPI